MSNSSPKYPDVTDLLQKSNEELLSFMVNYLKEDVHGAFELLKDLLDANKEKTIVLLNNLFSSKDSSDTQFYLGTMDFYNQTNKEFTSSARNLLKEAINQQYEVDLKPIIFSIKLVLAWMDAYDGYYDNSYRDFETLNKEKANNASAIFGMAYNKEGLRDYTQAINLFNQYEKIVEVDPSQLDSVVFWHKGYCSIQLNHFEDAKNSFKQYVEANPNIVEGLNYLGYAAAQTNDFALADNSFDRALILNEQNFGATIGKKLIIEKRSLDENKKKLIVSTQEYLKGLFTAVPSGLNNVARMYVIQFSIGVFFIVLAIILAAFGNNNLVSGISGLAGGAITLVSLLNKAPIELQNNRVNSAQWMIAYYNWISALYLVNSASERFSKDGNTTWLEMKQSQDYLTNLTKETIKTMKEYLVSNGNSQDNSDATKKAYSTKSTPLKP